MGDDNDNDTDDDSLDFYREIQNMKREREIKNQNREKVRWAAAQKCRF